MDDKEIYYLLEKEYYDCEMPEYFIAREDQPFLHMFMRSYVVFKNNERILRSYTRRYTDGSEQYGQVDDPNDETKKFLFELRLKK